MKPNLRLLAALFLAIAFTPLGAQTPPPPGTDPNADPEGTTGALKDQITTGGSYSAHSGNGSRSVTDLEVPGAVGYGLDFTRHWNSTDGSLSPEGHTVGPQPFGAGGWTRFTEILFRHLGWQ